MKRSLFWLFFTAQRQKLHLMSWIWF
jgi:hypothetical protein